MKFSLKAHIFHIKADNNDLPNVAKTSTGSRKYHSEECSVSMGKHDREEGMNSQTIYPG